MAQGKLSTWYGRDGLVMLGAYGTVPVMVNL